MAEGWGERTGELLSLFLVPTIGANWSWVVRRAVFLFRLPSAGRLRGGVTVRGTASDSHPPLLYTVPTLPYPTLLYSTLPYPTPPYPTLPYPTLRLSIAGTQNGGLHQFAPSRVTLCLEHHDFRCIKYNNPFSDPIFVQQLDVCIFRSSFISIHSTSAWSYPRPEALPLSACSRDVNGRFRPPFFDGSREDAFRYMSRGRMG